jgi:hypothetical protein
MKMTGKRQDNMNSVFFTYKKKVSIHTAFITLDFCYELTAGHPTFYDLYNIKIRIY